MALAMMGGVIAATVLTLTFLPALYALAFGVALPSGREVQSAAAGHSSAARTAAMLFWALMASGQTASAPSYANVMAGVRHLSASAARA
jgi:hypothetical protein